jgi:anionic cell wall polymer biosynthesis LytR-Cps2A-Psr (LCP) family protein
MFANFFTKISRLLNRTPLKKRDKAHNSHTDYKIKKDQDIGKNNKLKIGIIVIIILTCILLIVFVIHISLSIFQYSPKTFPDSTARERNENTNQRIKTIMFLVLDRPDDAHVFVDGLAVISYNFDTKKTAIFSINPDLKIYSTRLGKDLFIRTAFNDISPNEMKMNYFTEGVESLLAIKIDNYIVTDILTFNDFSKYISPVYFSVEQNIKDQDVVNLPDKQTKQWNKGNVLLKGDDLLEFLASNDNGSDDQLNRQASIMKKLIMNIFNIQNLINIPQLCTSVKNGFFYTDITKEEIYKMAFEFLQVKDSNVEYGYTKAKSYYSVYAVSYYPVYSAIFSIVDNDIGSVFSDISIFKEQARIELLNGSSIKGLASNRARWVSNTGARIIKIGNSYESEKKTKIYCEDPSKFPKTISAIQRIFDGKAELINKDYYQRHIGDVIIVIGDDY